MPKKNTTISISADRLGIIASAACFVHCILTPVILSFAAVWAHFLPSEERFHRTLAVFVTAFGAFAILSGFKKHRRARVVALMVTGLFFIFTGAYWGDRLPSHIAEIAVTMIGSCLMISAHLINHTFCKRCECVEDVCDS